MGGHQFMLGRELPCTVVDLLEIRLMPLPGATHDALVKQVETGQAYPDVLYRLGLSHLGRQELGLAKQNLLAAVTQKPDYPSARMALAAVCDLLAQHSEAVDHLDAVITSDKPFGFGPCSDAPKITRDEPKIDWSESAADIARHVRAFDPTPGAYTAGAGATIKIWSVRAAASVTELLANGQVALAGGALIAGCGDGEAIVIDQLQSAGGRRLSGVEWARGRPDLAALRLGT